MKNLYFTITLISVLFLSACNLGSNNQSISVKKNKNEYRFEATYPVDKTERVVGYMQKILKADNPYKSENEKINATIGLPNGSQFYLNAQPGLIVIDFKKQKNSFTSYQQMEDLCMGIKEILQD